MSKSLLLLDSYYLKSYKSTTPSLRHTCLINKNVLWNGKSIRNLRFLHKKYLCGRNRNGSLILYTRSFLKYKSVYRVVDFKFSNFGVPGIVSRVEYDPNRSSFIALVYLKNGICCYVTHTYNLCIGDTFFCYYYNIDSAFLKNGDICILNIFPDGSLIHNVEKIPFLGSIYSRAAGAYSTVIRKYKHIKKCLIKFKSGIYKFLSFECKAIFGISSNYLHKRIMYGKAGRSRWLGIKPNVRGVAMNPIDHPHGGGNGKKSKKCSPRTPWGKMLKWKKTSNYSNLLIHDIL